MLQFLSSLLIFSTILSAASVKWSAVPLAFEKRGANYVARAADSSFTIAGTRALLTADGQQVQMRFDQADPGSTCEGLGHMPAHATYFEGSSSPQTFDLYTQVRCRSIYPGIDLTYHGSGQRLEYDFRVAPGVSEERIAVAFSGVSKIKIEGGDLVLSLPSRQIRQPKPIAWQIIDGRREPVKVDYRIDSAGRVRFETGPRKASFPLIIDPVLVFDTIIVTASPSAATGLALDASGNAYVTGVMGGSNQSSGQIFVMKWDPTGANLLYATYLNGNGAQSSTGIALDAAGDTYITGFTQASNFPVAANAFQKTLVGHQNAFITKISPDGSQLLYSTYFGGGTEQSSAIAVDASGAAYITGSVTATLPVTTGVFQPVPGDGSCVTHTYLDYPSTGDAFIAKLSADGSSLVYSSYLGGLCGDSGSGLTVNSDGSVWLAGTTFSPNFPATSNALRSTFNGGYSDGFVARVSPDGDQLQYSTYLGGVNYTATNAITADSSGNLYLTGSSNGFSEPASPGAYQATAQNDCLQLGLPLYPYGNAFVLILNPTATAVTGLTYLGGVCTDAGTSIALDPSGAIWIAGPDFAPPLVNPLEIQTSLFLSKFSPDLTQLLFSTEFDDIAGLAIDSSGMPVVAGNTVVGPSQAYLAKIDPSPSPITLNNVASASVSPVATEGVVPGKVIRVEGSGIGPSAQTPGIVNNGVIATSVAGVQVTFNGIPAALLYVSATEIECIVPWEIPAPSEPAIQVTYNGVSSNILKVPIWSSFNSEVLNVLNDDGSPNSQSNPAAPGSEMAVYLTGAGQTNPPSFDGQVYTNAVPAPVNAIGVACLGYGPLTVTAAVAAPGLATGILQINFQTPSQPPPGECEVLVNGSDGGFFSIWLQ